ncbi:MAG: tetratricopeptide repeat protein [Anaerolineae bacterium]
MSLTLASAQLHYQSDDKKAALADLQRIQQRYHAIYKPAQQLTLRIATELGDTKTARNAALRLFSMRMNAQDQLQLAATLHRLGEGEKAVQLERRVKTVSSNDINQLVQLMQQQTGRGAKKEAAGLAKQILRHLGKASMNQEYYRRSALQALKEADQLEPRIAEAEKQLAANPNAVRAFGFTFPQTNITCVSGGWQKPGRILSSALTDPVLPRRCRRFPCYNLY